MAGCAAGGPGGTHAAAGAIGCGAPEGAGSGRAPRFARGHPHLPCGCRCAPLSFTESSPRQSNRSGNPLLSRVSWTAILLHPDPRTPSALLFTGRDVMCRGNTFHLIAPHTPDSPLCLFLHPRLTSGPVIPQAATSNACNLMGKHVNLVAFHTPGFPLPLLHRPQRHVPGKHIQSYRTSHPRLTSALVDPPHTHLALVFTPQTHTCACCSTPDSHMRLLMHRAHRAAAAAAGAAAALGPAAAARAVGARRRSQLRDSQRLRQR